MNNKITCVHGDDPDECSFCFGANEPKFKKEKEKSKDHFDIVKQKKEKNQQFEPIKLNRTSNRVLDMVISTLKDAEWPRGVSHENWRQVSIDAIEKYFGRT